MGRVQEWFFKIIEKYSTIIFICFILGMFVGYFGIYSLLGYEVIVKSKGMVKLSTVGSISSIIAGIIIVFYILKNNKNSD